MAMSSLISSSSKNKNQRGFITPSSSNNHRNRSLTLFPDLLINAGSEEAVMNHGSDQKVMNIKGSLNHPNNQMMNRNLSAVVPSFNGGVQQDVNGVSVNHSNDIRGGLTLFPSLLIDQKPVMNTGFSVSNCSNHENLMLSVSPPSIAARTQELYLMVWRSYVREASRLRASGEIKRARLLLAALSIRRRRTGVRTPMNINGSQQQRSARRSYDDNYDGVTHSLPYRKHGPYTCPRCFRSFATSQIFAAHVASHYRDETDAQRKRRVFAKMRSRNHRRVGITVFPPEARGAAAAAGGARGGGVRVKEEPAEYF